MPQQKKGNRPAPLPKKAPTIDNAELHKAMFEFQTRFQGVEKLRVNLFTGSNYASRDDVMNAAQPLLTELKLLIIYTTTLVPGQDNSYITLLFCNVIHLPTGQKMVSSLPLPDISEGAQATGSFMTYWERYLFCGLFNISETADDDGNATMPVQQGATKMTEKQHSEILDFVDATGTKVGNADTEGTLLHHINQTMNLTEVDQMSSRQASTILKMLKTKYKRQQEGGK